MRFPILSILIFMLYACAVQAQAGWQTDTVHIGNIQQVIATKGVKDGPVLLFLHGGPGSSRMKQADLFSDELQRQFLVVQWDQRETGYTLAVNKTPGSITLDMMVNDTHALIDTLLKKYHQSKIYLAGESWGTVLGFRMAKLYPEQLYAYLAFSPVTDQAESERLLLRQLMNDAKSKHNTAEIHELEKVKIPFDNTDQIYYLRKWWFAYEGKPLPDKDTAAVKSYLKDWGATWLPVWRTAMDDNLFVSLPEIKCPVYFFLGGKDYQTNCMIAKKYYEQLKAPEKDMFWFENASHDVLVSDAVEVQRIILSKILRRHTDE